MRFVEVHVRTAKRDVRREIPLEQGFPTMDGTADGLHQFAARTLSSPSAAANGVRASGSEPLIARTPLA